MGSNSFFSKLATYDPINQLTHGKSNQLGAAGLKILDPVGGSIIGKALKGGYSTSSGPGTPGPYAGVTPTLADANAGYVRAAAGAAQPAPGNSMNNLFGQPPTRPGAVPGVNPVPRPVVRPQPIIPGQQQQTTWG